MAQLKDTIVSGNLRVTDTTLTDRLQVTTIKAPTSAGGTTYGPGSDGQVLKSNGTTTYWGADNNSSTVLQSSTTTSNFRPFVFGTKDTTTISSLADTVTGQLYTSTRLFFQPSSGNLYMYSPSGDSPALIFQRGTFIDGNLDWKMYDTGGALRFAQAGRNTSTETWVTVVEHKTATNTASTPAIRSMLGVYGTTYGNTAANMLSGTAGLFQYGDGGPQIDFSTTPGGTQSGALIFTDHDTAATGASWHFVSTESDWNVTSKRFHAKTSISIGTNLPNTSYNLYVNGTTNITGATTVGGLLTTQANQYGDNFNSGAIDMQNSNLCGVNAIYTGDTSDNAAEGIHFYRDSTHVDTLWMSGGVLLFVPNRELGSSTSAADSQKVARFTVNPTGGQVVITDSTSGGVKSSGYTIATSVPSGAVFTDTKVTSSANHYTPATASGSDKTASASGATAAWSIDVVKGVTLNTDGKGHVTGISVTSGKIPANPVPSNNVTGSGTSGHLAKWDGTNTITNGPQLGSSTTTFLRNDGSWATPTDTDEKVKVDLFTSTTSTDYMITGATAAMATTAAHLVIDTADGVAGVRMRLQKGTTSAVGQAMLMLGNDIASGTAKNMQGSILMYASTTRYGKIDAAALTDNRTWTMPNKTGTVALTSDIPSFSVTSSGTGPVVTGMSYSSGVLTYTKGRVLSTSGGQWIAGRDNAPVLANSNSSTAGSFYPMGAVKTKTGAWAIGALGNGDSLAFSFSTDTNYSGGSNTTNNYYIGTDGAFTGTAAGLTAKALTAETFGTTDGSFVFKGTSLFGGTDSYDWVGIQADASNDMFQLVAGGNNGVFFREKDDSSGWSAWYALLTNAMITGSSGITVTPHTIKIGGDNGTTINGGVTISHSNSITAQTSTVFKKFSYDTNGHITGVANVAASDITALGIVGTDQNMTQTNTTGSAAYRVLLSGNANDNNETTTGRKSSKLTFNPSTGALTVSGPATATNFFGKLTQISGSTPSGRVTSADITGGTTAQYNDASMQLILATSSMTTGKPASDGYIMHYNWDNAGICRAQFFIADNNCNDAVQYRTQGSAQQTWGAQPWTTLLSEKNAFTWSRLCDRFYITPTEPGFLRILTLGSEEQNGRVMGSVKITISTDYNDYPPEIVCFEVMNVYKTAPAIHVLKSIQLGEKTSAAHVITLVRLLKNSTGTEQYVEIYYNGESGKHINFSVRYEVFVPYETFDREAIPISMPNNNTTLTVSPTTPTSDVILNDPTVIPKEVSYNMMRIGDHWGIATPVGTLNLPFATGLSGSDIEWVRTTRHGFLPYQSRSAGAGNETDTSGGACYLGTSTWYFARAYIENTVGSLGTFQASTESDIPTSTGYQNGTMSFLQTPSAYGGTDYRSGNSGSYWWAHYLTFKQNSSYRYILRLPFWGVPQYQYTTNGANQRWRTFITDENLDSARLGTEATSVAMQTGTPMPRIMAPLFQFHRANKFAFMPADKITIESSTDSGSTWQTYSATDAVKRSLFISKTAGAAIMIGPKSSATRTSSMRTRIIVECDGRDVIIDRLLFLISSNASSIAIDVKIALSSAPTTYIPIVTNGVASGTYAYEYLINLKHQSGTETIGGVSNVPKNYRFKTNNVLKFVFEFRYVSVSNTAYIGGILGYSGTYWDNDTTYTNKSYFAQHDHIYDWDIDQNAYFPADIYIGSNKVARSHSSLNTAIGSASTAANTKTFFDTDAVPTKDVSVGYNSSGSEFAFLFAKGNSNSYGTVLKWGYAEKYIYMLRKQGGTWKSTDWEKISAGYADSAGTVSTESDTAAGARPVFYAGLSNTSKVVYNSNFTYNPSRGILQTEQLALKSGSYTTTIEKGTTTANRTLVLPDASGGIGIANILLNDPTNSTNPVPVSGSLSDYDYFTIVISMNGSNSDQSSSTIVPAIAGSHFFLFQVLESVGSGGSMLFPAGVVITTTSTTISFSVGVNRGINIPSSGSSTSIATPRTAYIKMIIGHKS